jgi:hypothetical protein
MRKHLVLLALASSAAAEPKREAIDVKAADVVAFRDELGKLYVLPKQPTSENTQTLTFYGDGRTMFLQRVAGYSNHQGDVTLSIWSPRVKNMSNGQLEQKADGTANVICKMTHSKFERKALTPLTEEETAQLVATARFEPVLWDRQVFFFGRGDSTTYYLVDVLREDLQGHRLFVGKKGQMKELPLTDFAKDSGGTTVVTKKGELAIAGDTATWKQGKKTAAVSPLDPKRNAFLIYRELGVYGRLGTICEDQ